MQNLSSHDSLFYYGLLYFFVLFLPYNTAHSNTQFVLLVLSLSHPVSASDGEGLVWIAIVDTGIREIHEVLDGRHIVKGCNYAFPQEDTKDLVGHGTRVAGLAAQLKAYNPEMKP